MVVADRDAVAAEALAKSLGAGSFSIALDVTNQESIDGLWQKRMDRPWRWVGKA